VLFKLCLQTIQFVLLAVMKLSKFTIQKRAKCGFGGQPLKGSSFDFTSIYCLITGRMSEIHMAPEVEQEDNSLRFFAFCRG
jgi:hypothetical protein